jgi:hypothetical protein
MPSTGWIRSGARALRDAVTRVHRRAEPLPRLPFGIAFAMAVVALVVALEFRPPSEAVTVEIGEHPSEGPAPWSADRFAAEEAEFEIVEYGIGKVTVQHLPRIIVGAVVRNPYDRDLSSGALSLTAEAEDGHLIRIEDFHVGTIPPETSVSVAFVASGAGEMAVEELRIDVIEPSYLYTAPSEGEGDGGFAPTPALPEVTLLGTEPLLSPDGYRLRYRLDAPEATEAQISVLFRDDEGRLLGGVPAGDEPFDRFHDGWAADQSYVEEGETLRHVDIPRAWMPEGTDPDRFEVGPSA